MAERMFTMGVADLAHTSLDRLLHTVGPDFSEADLLRVYCLLERGLLAEHLPVEVVVPVALTKFDAPEPVLLGPHARLEPISEDLQKARAPESHYTLTAHPCALDAASHAVVLGNLHFDNTSRYILHTGKIDFYEHVAIDEVFSALRVATPIPTGYAQVFMRPVGWAWDFKADLPPVVTGAAVRRYPADFDDGRWLDEQLPVVTSDVVEEAGRVFRALHDAPRRLTLAAERLSAAMLRERESDRILDLCIGLEAVLGDESAGETTYKLSVRAAAVLADAGLAVTPQQVFREMKRIYAFRSDIAHGRDPARRRTLQRDDAEIEAVDAARDYLRYAVAALCDKHELAEKPEHLDEGVILSAIGRLKDS